MGLELAALPRGEGWVEEGERKGMEDLGKEEQGRGYFRGELGEHNVGGLLTIFYSQILKNF